MHRPTNTRRQLLTGFAAVGAGTLLGPQLGTREVQAAGSPTLTLIWNRIALEAIRRTNTNPPVAARALAVLHTCLYDTWTLYDRKALPVTVRLSRQTADATARAAALAVAAHAALVDLFPSQASLCDDLLTGLGYRRPEHPDLSTPAGVGALAAAAVLAERHTDGSNQLGDLQPGAYSDYTGYRPVNAPDRVVDTDRWQPLAITTPSGPGVQPFIVPHWQRVQPFALKAASEFRPGPPHRSGTAAFRTQAEELLALSAGLTDEQKLIVEYWLDGSFSETPPGHWCALASRVSERDGHDESRDVLMYFLLTNAVFDAGIAAWDAKRTYDAVRPYTAVRELYTGTQVRAWTGVYRGSGTIAGRRWTPYQPLPVFSPPHPEYVSGHSTFSAAAAEVLKRFTGSDRFGAEHVQPAGTCRIEPYLVPDRTLRLSWPTFTAAAVEAGLSRRLGGIHFLAADREGQQLGRRVADRVWGRAIALIEGRPNG
jgi:hypothetical protein